MTTVTLSLVSHTNVGKTALARTLLGRDVGEVRDAPHVTEFADAHELLTSPQGDRLVLWDTPGFGDSVRLVRRMRRQGRPLGWLLSEVWDRWRDRPFWASQQALRHVRDGTEVLLYLVNASEPAAGYLAPEMELLGWTGKPVIVLLNQLGAPRAAAVEAAELADWRERLARWPAVREVLPLDAFARCWVHEGTLLAALARVLEGEQAAAMARLAACWTAQREAQFAQSLDVLAAGLARLGAARVELEGAAGLGERLRRIGVPLGAGAAAAGGPAEEAQQRLAERLQGELAADTAQLLALHGLQGEAGRAALEQVLERVAGQGQAHRRVPEGRAAVLGGALTGALAGLKADIATGGLTLGGGLLAGGLLGALGAAGLARGLNVMRGRDRDWVGWSDAAMQSIAEAALLRYLAVAHFGRGRGDWAVGEAPAHWPEAVRAALALRGADWAAAWAARSTRLDAPGEAERLAALLRPLVEAAARAVLASLYPGARSDSPAE
jgi:hypothetical protein